MKLKLLPKFIISLAILAVLLIVANSLFSYNTSKNYLEDMYAQRVLVNCNAIASMLDTEDVRTVIAPDGDKSETYTKMEALLNKLKADGEVTYLSLVVPDAEAVTFYIDAMVPEMGDDPANQIPYGSRILYVDAASDETDLRNYELIWVQYAQNKGVDVPVITDNDYGFNYTGVAPILDENGKAIAEIQYILDMGEVRAYLNSVLINMLTISFAITVLAMLGYIFFVRKTVVTPIGKLAKFTQDITGSDGFADERADIRTGDEIESLNDSFNYMLDELGVYINNLSKVTAEKERISTELNVATQIQADMLPRIFPAFPNRSDFELYASMTPAKEVGGDFYDFFLIDDDHIGLVMADVSGKGVPAALFMVIAKTLIKNRTMMGGSPAEILSYVNNQLCEGNDAGLFVTVWLAIVELSTGKGMAANAGHEHPVLKHADGDYELVKYRHSPAVATMEGMRFKEHEFQLRPGDCLYVYTDGVPDAERADGARFGTDLLIEAMNRMKEKPVAELLPAIKEEIDRFANGFAQFDDITMLGFQYHGPAGDEKTLRTPARRDQVQPMLDFLEEFLTSNGVPMKTTRQILLAGEETIVNVANYAYPEQEGEMELALSAKNGSVTMTLTDSGIPFDPTAKADPDVTLSAEDRPIGGLGIYMTKKLMDAVEYRRDGDRNILTIRKQYS